MLALADFNQYTKKRPENVRSFTEYSRDDHFTFTPVEDLDIFFQIRTPENSDKMTTKRSKQRFSRC